MLKTKISSKGQVVIPKAVRTSLRWPAGTELELEPSGDAIVLRMAVPVRRLPTQDELNRVAGCLKYDGPSISIEEMDKRAREAFGRNWRK